MVDDKLQAAADEETQERAESQLSEAVEAVLADDAAAIEPAGTTSPVRADEIDTVDVLEAIAPTGEAEVSPVFKELADVKLPALKRENRARLQMQSPTRLYFYWAVRENPWSLLNNIFGDGMGNYGLVLKLTDLTHGTEKVYRCEAEGNWWFDVEPDREYQAEIGFHSTARPYFRILYSNRVSTPRRTPSPRAATEADWMVSAGQFAQVLGAAGFSRDAFDVVMAGDDMGLAEVSSEKAFAEFIGDGNFVLGGIAADEIRFALLALAAGTSLPELRGRISPALFELLEQNEERVDAERAMESLTEYFELDDEFIEEQEIGPAVFGASLVSFPRGLKTRTASPKLPSGLRSLSPISSFSLR